MYETIVVQIQSRKMNSSFIIFGLLILLVANQTCQGIYLKPHQVRAEVYEMAAKAMEKFKKAGAPEPELTKEEPEVNLVLPYNYDVDSNGNGVFDDEDQSQLKVFLAALGELTRKNGRPRFG